MGFSSTIGKLDERVPWKNSYWNTHIDDVDAAMSSITASDLAEDIVLSAGQNINGSGNSLYGFKRYFGFGGTGYCIVDVTAYSAGTGLAGDSSRIQSAIDDLPNSGGCIFFPPGTYNVENSIWLCGSNNDKSNVTLVGAGPSTKIFTTGTKANVPIFVMGNRSGYSEGMQIRDLMIDGSSTVDGYHAGISLEGSKRAFVSNCTFNAIEGSGIHAIGSISAKIDRCNFLSCGSSTSSEGHGIYHAATVGQNTRSAEIIGLQISRCFFSDNDGSGIKMASCSNLGIVDCFFESNDQYGILVESIFGSGSKGIKIRSCQFYDNKEDAVAFNSRIPGTSITGFVVSGNVMLGSSYQNNGISLYGSEESPIRHFSITGNSCSFHLDNGIWLRNGCAYGTVAGNTCANNGISIAGAAGIELSGGVDEQVEYVSVTGNACNDDRSGGSRTQAYGIRFAAYSRNNVCVGNVVDNNTTSDVLDSGTDNDVSHTPGA
jgi:hypothetical protein